MTRCSNLQLPVSARKVLLRLIVALTGVGASSVTLGQDVPDSGRISLGETDLYPSLRLELGTNNNAFLESSNEETTTTFAVQPGFIWLASKGSTTLRADYSGNFTANSVSELNVQTHDFGLDARAVLGRQWRVAALASIARNSFELGSNRTIGAGRDFDEPFIFNDIDFSSFVTFGAQGARGNIEFGVRGRTLDSRNQSETSGGFDNDRFGPFGVFSLRVSGDTRLTFETRFESVDFDFDSSDRDDLTFLIGLRFAATGRLSGSLDVGATQLFFDTPGIDDRTETVASATLRFEATERAIFRLTARRSVDFSSAIDAVGNEDRVLNLLRLQWDQQFSGRISHVAFVESAIRDLECPSRGSTRINLGYELGLSVRRWFEVGASVTSLSRDFDDCPGAENADIDFTRQQLGVFVNLTL